MPRNMMVTKTFEFSIEQISLTGIYVIINEGLYSNLKIGYNIIGTIGNIYLSYPNKTGFNTLYNIKLSPDVENSIIITITPTN